MTAFDVVCFGALNLDKLFKVHSIASKEEESFVESYVETCGGSAANTAVGLARLGCKVGFIGKVAEDREGRKLLEDFYKEHVNTEGIIQTGEGRSGTAMGFVDRQGQRALYIDPGVNDTIKLDEIDIGYAANVDFLHLTSFVGETSFQTQKNLLKTLPKKIRVSFDPGNLYAARGLKEMETIVERSFVMMPNSSELQLLTDEKDYCKAADLMIQKGVKTVAVKLGSKGCYVTDGQDGRIIEPFETRVVDTTGAGDAFCAGFLYGLLKDKDIFQCGRFGNFVASKSIAEMGARTGVPRITDLKLDKIFN